MYYYDMSGILLPWNTPILKLFTSFAYRKLGPRGSTRTTHPDPDAEIVGAIGD